eukprot:TRINITY_DN35320_c0_g1_i1.p1 TRINITY_DN35320_c0_g1~~TRINITY_DN35320_c0_g1_i1.p1  ORF type:complete len:513 (-),score=82.62 TRINITY_DN35320_c0_g1_i1:265-1803(-)
MIISLFFLGSLAVVSAVRRTPVLNAVHEDLIIRRAQRVLSSSGDLPEQWFVQRRDHFDAQDDQTWRQRYFVNDTFYDPARGGPVFFELGGEGAISAGYVVGSQMSIYASHENALLVALEHRFYGKSQPTGDLALDSLRLLSSHQALADAAFFLASLLEDPRYAKAGPVIVFGGSYPGALAAWFRQQYPHLAKAAIASSAPVQATLDMVQYLDVVGASVRTIGGEQCDAAFATAFGAIQDLATTASGVSRLNHMFQTCTPLPVLNTSTGVVPKDLASFASSLMGMVMGTVQYNREVPQRPTVTHLCQIMLNTSSGEPTDPQVALQNLAQMARGFYSGCLDISYAEMVRGLRSTSVAGNAGVGERQWTYQTCTQFGYFQTTDSPFPSVQPFGTLVGLSFYVDMCRDVFGTAGSASASGPISPLSPRINATNAMYGAKHPQGATRICYVNGSVDPWHSLSVTQNLTASLVAEFINGTAHCANMEPYNPIVDPPALLPAQHHIASRIHEWILAGNM